MKSFAALSLALGASVVNAQVFTCDGYRRPDWDDCQQVVADFDMEGNPDIFHENGKDDPAPSCKWWYKNDGNCRITHCYQDTTQEGDDPRTIQGGQIFDLYDQIRSRCVPFRAGGEFTGALEFVTAFNDEDSAVAVASAPGTVVEQNDNGLTVGQSSLEEYMEWLNDTKPAEPAPEKRQNEDDVVRIDFTAFGIRNPNAYENGPRLSRGVGYKYEVSESTSFGVTTTLNLGATWNIFTASAGIEMSQTDTYTVTEGRVPSPRSVGLRLTNIRPHL